MYGYGWEELALDTIVMGVQCDMVSGYGCVRYAWVICSDGGFDMGSEYGDDVMPGFLRYGYSEKWD